MKLNKILIGALVAMMTLSSCDDALDKSPYDSIDDKTAFETVSDFENATRGLYNGFIGNDADAGTEYFGGGMFISPDVASDNLIVNQSGRQTRKTLFDWNHDAAVSGFGLYTNAYIVINRANKILENIENLSDGDFKNKTKAQALAARGIAHFDLARTYAKIPVQSADANASLGVVYSETSDPFALPTRETVAENYAHIISDLEEAKSLASTEVSSLNVLSLETINGFLSRVYLYNGENQKAADAANAVTTSVAPIGTFSNVWKDASNDGVIAKFLITDVNSVDIGTEYSQTSPQGTRSEYVVAFDFYNLFSDEDIRKSAYMFTGSFGGNNYNNVGKYLGKTGQVNGIVDSKILRAGEVVLNKAEALYNLGNEAEALAALNTLRQNRYTGFTPGTETGTDLLDAIRLERRLELAFEGHRFYDLKRWGLSINRSNDGDQADGSGVPAVNQTLDAGSHKFQFAIPQGAINANPNMVQNPGY
ncbi:RagB/SusD family nutrient uptake outer membrane protein [Aureivirga sp. CE67]|uniref:RagB/SusD family nutrient uptake outer membrane protein n=1 Tax=Aureivirga sp. CE67 TaxID=1788983 RepID=UPI0018CB8195|nr:RagB/SusD family nutrient uptake outer membrane protein [Aureivirga sp. CE67]